MLFTWIILHHFTFWTVCSLRHSQKNEGNLPIERYLKRYILISYASQIKSTKDRGKTELEWSGTISQKNQKI